MCSKCVTIRLPGEKEMEQNLRFWLHLRTHVFLLWSWELSQPWCITAALQPWGKKTSLCSWKEKSCQSLEVQRLCWWSVGHFRKALYCVWYWTDFRDQETSSCPTDGMTQIWLYMQSNKQAKSLPSLKELGFTDWPVLWAGSDVEHC